AEGVGGLGETGGLLGDGLEGGLVGGLGLRRRKILGRERPGQDGEGQGEKATTSLHTNTLFLWDHGEPSTILAGGGPCKFLRKLLACVPAADRVCSDALAPPSLEQGEPP